MTEPSTLVPLRLIERVIPVPASVSPQAQAALSRGAMNADAPSGFPEGTDVETWAAWAAAADGYMRTLQFGAPFEHLVDAAAVTLGGVPGYILSPKERDDAAPARIMFDLHGGGLIMGGGDLCQAMATATAATFGAIVYAPDYRLLPHHPYPAALDDCIAAYRALIEQHDPDRIVIQGSSGGGNLAAALMLRVGEMGLPFPAGLILQSPEVDLTESGDSFATNRGVDVVLRQGMGPVNALYANGHDLSEPMLSPLFGDFSNGFPPTLITTGTRDLFLSNAVRMYNVLRRAGTPVEFLIYEAMPHVGFFGAPEDQEMASEMRVFAERCWSPAVK